MKKVILDEKDYTTISASKLTGSEIVAYKCPNSNNICILRRKSNLNQYGFYSVSTGFTEGWGPVFVDYTLRGALENAAKNNRTLYAFDDFKAFAKAVANNEIK